MLRTAALTLVTLAAPALDRPFRPSPVPGGVAAVPLPASHRAPEARYHGVPVWVRRDGAGWTAMVGIPLAAKPGPDALEVAGRTLPFRILPKRYPEQRITLKDTRTVEPDPDDQQRIEQEQAQLAPALRAWPEGLRATLAFRQPTQGRLTGSFGLRRIFNGQPRNPHSGLDIAAPKGRPVVAPADGVVTLAGDFFFSGKTVVLAHGEGVTSLLGHLSDLTVSPGQAVKAGDLVGHVGATGRATGPHLHWTLSLNDARVDPRLFLPPAPAPAPAPARPRRGRR